MAKLAARSYVKSVTRCSRFIITLPVASERSRKGRKMRKIPRVIHQVYTAGWQRLPEEIRALTEQLRNLNPDYEYRFYDEPAILAWIETHFGEDMLALYQRINPEYGAARADLFRYLVIYQEGGVYLDVKSFCSRPLDEVIPADCELMLFHWDNQPGGQDHKKGLHKELAELPHGEYQQWNVIAAPRSPWLREVIDEVTSRIKNYQPATYGIGMKGVLSTTGPIAFTLAIRRIPFSKHVHVVRDHRTVGLKYCGVDSSVLKRFKKSAYARLKTPVVTLSERDHARYQLWLFFVFPFKRLHKNIVNETDIALKKTSRLLGDRRVNRAPKGRKGWVGAFRRTGKRLGLLVAAVLALTGLHAGYEQLTGNFHEVIEGELYRSAQPDATDIAEYSERYHIRTILNLRDEPRGDWYEQEKASADVHGIQLVDYPLSSSKEISVREAEKLAELMKTLPRPLLIHCDHGANRTGLVSAIYLDAVAQTSDLIAQLQLSPWYGHFPIPVMGRYAMYSSYKRFQIMSPY
ncbi:glycosyltransferase [Cronobacter turicensis]